MLTATVSWNWPDGWVEDFPDLNQIPNPVIDANATDKVCWVNSDNKEVDFSTKVTCNSEKDRIMRWHQWANLKCSLCNDCEDSHEHLFFNCSYSAKIWDWIKERNKMLFQNEKRTPDVLCRNVKDSVVSMLRAPNVKKSNALLIVAKVLGLNWRVFRRKSYFVISINSVVSQLWMDVLETIECCEVLVPWSFPGKCNHKDMVSGEFSELLIRFAAWFGVFEKWKYQRSYFGIVGGVDTVKPLICDTDGPDGSSPVDQRAVDENEAGGLSG
ncbi:hypothetical protein Tco_0223751 [Tanacetum coccineum]